MKRLIEAARQAGETFETDAETELVSILCHTLETMLYLEKAFIWFYFPATGDLQLAGGENNQSLRIPLDGDVLRYLIQTLPPLEPSSLVLGALSGVLAELDVQMCLPLVYQGRELVGLVGLGPRQDEEPFDHQDRQLLAHIAEYLLLLLKNVRTIHALRQSRERVSIVQEIEHKRIVQDLHDATLQNLACLATVQFELCKRATADPPRAVRLIKETQEQVKQVAVDFSQKSDCAELLAWLEATFTRSRVAPM